MKTGDILLVKGFIKKESLISRLIACFELLQLILKGKKLKDIPKIFVHAAIVVEEYGKCYVYEMKSWGCRRVLLDYWIKTHNSYTAMRYGRNLNKEEQASIELMAYNYYLQHVNYYFKGLLFHAIYIFTGKWKGETMNNDNYEQVCYELVANIFNSAITGTFDDPYKLKGSDIYFNKNFNKFTV